MPDGLVDVGPGDHEGVRRRAMDAFATKMTRAVLIADGAAKRLVSRAQPTRVAGTGRKARPGSTSH